MFSKRKYGLPTPSSRPVPPPPKQSHGVSYKMYETIYDCPLSVYIDITVDNKLNSLVISGKPTTEKLEETKMKLVYDFTEASGGIDMKGYTSIVGQYHQQLNIITGFDFSIELIKVGRYEKALQFLNANGLNCSIPETADAVDILLKSVEMKYKNRLAKFKEISTKYGELTAKKTEKPTRQYYSKLIIALSTCEAIKMQLNPKQMTVSDFAEYLNIYNEYLNHIKSTKYGKYRNYR